MRFTFKATPLWLGFSVLSAVSSFVIVAIFLINGPEFFGEASDVWIISHYGIWGWRLAVVCFWVIQAALVFPFFYGFERVHDYWFAIPSAPSVPQTVRGKILAAYTGRLPERLKNSVIDTLVASCGACVKELSATIDIMKDAQGNPLNPGLADRIHKAEQSTVDTCLLMLRYLEGALTILDDTGPLKAPLLGSIRNFGTVLGTFLQPLWNASPPQLFFDLTSKIDTNRAAASTQLLNHNQLMDGVTVSPQNHPGTPRDIVRAYLIGTPFYNLFDGDVYLGWKDPSIRFEHTWIIAPPRSGKTTLLQALIGYDLAAVQQGRASIIVIDSQGQMLDRIRSLALFDTVRLVVIDPDPEEGLLGINPFSTWHGEDETTETSVVNLLTFVVNSLMEATLTARQRSMFRPLVRALLKTPNATLKTMQEVLQGTTKLDVSNLDPDTRAYFENSFYKDTSLRETKEQIAWRIHAIFQESRTMARMLSYPQNDIDFSRFMDTPGVMLIRTNQRMLSNDGAAFFGRLCIAQILRAAQLRAGNGGDLPVYVYIDEAHEYLNDPNVPVLLDQVRKYNVGLIVAHQRLGQLDAGVYDALANDAGTIMASRIQDPRAAATMGSFMRCDPELIRDCRTGEFAVFIRDQPPTVKVSVPGSVLESMPRRVVRPMRSPPRQEPAPEQEQEQKPTPEQKPQVSEKAPPRPKRTPPDSTEASTEF